MSFNLLPLDHQDIVGGLPSFNNTLLLIETIKNLPSHSLTFEDKREGSEKKDEQDSLGMQINQIEKVHSQTSSARKRKTGCTCTKTNCLKRYCECFSSGKLCGQDCGCCECFNTDQNQQMIKQAKEDIKCKSSRKMNQGCICKKSQCQKKYCECFNAGMACTELCKCRDCQNHSPHVHQTQDNGSRRSKHRVKQPDNVKSEQSLAYMDVISSLDI